MHWGFCARSIAIGGICLAATMAAGVLVEPAHAQMQQLDGGAARAIDEFYPQWAKPYLSSGFYGGSSLAAGGNALAYTAPVGSGTMRIFIEDNAGAGGTAGSFFGPPLFSPTSQRQDWFGAGAGNGAWRTAILGSYKSEPNTALSGLYTTASFGVTGIRTSPSGIPGVADFSAGRDVTGLSASAGVGLHLTPDITVEGSVTWTQVQPSTFR